MPHHPKERLVFGQIHRSVAIAAFASSLLLVGCGGGATVGSTGCATAASALVLILRPAATFDAPTLSATAAVMRRRVKSLAMKDTKVCVVNDSVVVSAREPIGEVQRRVLEARGKLEFRPVFAEVDATDRAYRSTKPDCEGTSRVFTNTDSAKPITLCARTTDSTGEDAPRDQWPKMTLGLPALEGGQVKGAVAELSGISETSWDVSLDLTSDGATRFQRITGALACDRGVKRQLAIVLDGVVESHPQMAADVVCKVGISQGHAIITGNFTESKAKELALILRSGALPIDVVPEP